MLENIPPTVTIELPESDGVERTDNKIWYNADHEIKVSIDDENSGINEIVITVNGKEFMTQSFDKRDNENHVYTFSTDSISNTLKQPNGTFKISVTAIDNAGNKATSSEAYHVDKIRPKVDSIHFSTQSADGVTDVSQFVDTLEYGYYFTKPLNVSVNVSDEEPSSKLQKITYKLVWYDSNGKVQKEEDDERRIIQTSTTEKRGTSESFEIPGGFKGRVFVIAYDKVGNASSEEIQPSTTHGLIVDTPENHNSEEHIIISNPGNTNYTDSEGYPLFDTDVNMTIKITDTMSGIRSFTYALSSEQANQPAVTIDIDNAGHALGESLGDDWIITAMDNNLVTEVTKTYAFNSDNNNVQLSFSMTDRAKNISSKNSDIFSLDKTIPVINVEFNSPAGNSEYYRESRTATVTVIERNFDASRINASIQNAIGSVPALSFTDNSNTEHTAILTFSEGDYTFSIDGLDRCGHLATVNYSGGNERSFHVDLTDPVETDNFDKFINNRENSFNVDKEMSITVTEHNFNASQANLRIYRVPAGQVLNTSTRVDCTSEYISENMWSSSGDTHSIRFLFSSDYVYQVAISITDSSGRTFAEKTSPVFEIDKTVPVLKTPVNLESFVYTEDDKDKSAEPIVFEDSNIAGIEYEVVSYNMKPNDDNAEYDVASDYKKGDVESGTYEISDEYFSEDGIYEVKCVAHDVAGNKSEQSTHTFVVQRDSDFLVYIPESNKENQTGCYKLEKSVRYTNFDDVEIISYINEKKRLGIEVFGNVVDDSYIDGGKDEKIKINKIDKYAITLKKSYISERYDEDTEYTLPLNAVAYNDDEDNSAQKIRLGYINIDNVKPSGDYESALRNLKWYEGFYGVNSKTFTIEGVSSDINPEQCEILANNEKIDFSYDENAHTISFTLNHGYTNIKSTLRDMAGNENVLPIKKNIYVGNMFFKLWYLFVGSGLVVISIPVTIGLIVIRKKKNSK